MAADGNEIGEFLRTRRDRIQPDDAGLPAYGDRRRVPGLRREEVALLAGVSVEYYTRIERGRAGAVSDDIIEGIAQALQLDDAERAHLVDMEGYAVALSCDQFGVPLRLVKHVSDNADGTAHDWPTAVAASAVVLGQWVEQHLDEA